TVEAQCRWFTGPELDLGELCFILAARRPTPTDSLAGWVFCFSFEPEKDERKPENGNVTELSDHDEIDRSGLSFVHCGHGHDDETKRAGSAGLLNPGMPAQLQTTSLPVLSAERRHVRTNRLARAADGVANRAKGGVGVLAKRGNGRD